MPPGFCLLPKYVEQLKAKIESGELDPAKLAEMTSEERHAAFADVVGDANAEHVNAAFETKLLLKNTQKGLETWAKSLTDVKPEIRRDLLARIGRMDERVLEPKARDAFLADLARRKLGVGVTLEEAGQIASLAKDVEAARTARDWPAYIDARVKFREYVGSLEPPDINRNNWMSFRTIKAFVRASALSFPTVIAKLTSVALSRTITTPLTDAVALGVSNALPRLAEGAPRYGTRLPATAWESEAAALTSMFTDGLADSKRLLQNKASRLDLMHGDKAKPHAWYEYFGSIHAALKEPIKQAEYARSMYRRTALAASRGEDIHDPFVMMRLSTEAYKDANTAIAMNPNPITDAWNSGLRKLEAKDPVTGHTNPLGTFVSHVLQTEAPIVKAPTNVVLDASEYIAGLPIGAARAAWNYARGLEDLAPLERDSIIRQISKGAIGSAIMALYFYKHDTIEFGGFYRKGEQRAPDDVPEGAARIGGPTGTVIPKALLHNPLFMAGQFAASVARVAPTKLRKRDEDPVGYASAVKAAAFGLIDEVPLTNAMQDWEALNDPQRSDQFVDKKLAGMAVPGVVQWIAKQTDDSAGVKRKPTGLVENLKANLPGLRRTVPTADAVAAQKKADDKAYRAAHPRAKSGKKNAP